MASKGRKQRKKYVHLQDEPDMPQERLTISEGFTTRTALGRRIYNRSMHKEALDLVTRPDHIHGRVPPRENKDMSGGIEQEQEEGGAFGVQLTEKETRGPTYRSMAPKGRKQRKRNVNFQDEPSQEKLTNTEARTPRAQSFTIDRENTSFTTRNQVGRRIDNGHMHQEAPNMVTRSDHSQGSLPPSSNEDMSVGIEQEEDEGSAFGSIIEKESRGPTYMKSIWGRPPNLPPISVEYNDFGQPIGGANSKLCHFLGSMARNGKYCPIDFNNWHAMPRRKKIEMLEVVKLRFHVPIIAEKWVLTSIGNKWRNWKHYLKARYWADVPIEYLIHDRDDRVLEDQWIKLLAYWRTEEAKNASKRNRNARAKKLMNQRTGKTSFAQVKARLTKEQGRCPTRVQLFSSCFVSSNGNSSDDVSSKISAMVERSDQLPEGSEDTIGPNDIFAQIMGKDKPGHVRMMGQGICPSDVWNETPRSTSNRLLLEYQEKIARLEAMLATQQIHRASQVDIGPDTRVSESLSLNATATQPNQVGTYVSLRSFITKKIVAKGRIHSIDPSTKVGGQMLGLNWCEINVKVVVEPKEQLIRPYDNFQELSQTVGHMIAWPCSLVTPIE